MIKVELESMINQPIEQVFERLIDIPGYSNWLPRSRVFISTQKTSDGPVGQGTTFIDKTRIGTYKGVVEEFKRPTSVIFRMKLRRFGMDVMESRPRYFLESKDGSTKVLHVAEGKLYGIFKLMRPYVERSAWEERRRTLDFLKKTLESSSP